MKVGLLMLFEGQKGRSNFFMNVEYFSPDDLIPYAGNAKKHPQDQIEHIANSIKNFGWTQPIVVDDENVVIIGHGRLAAAKLLKLDQVPVVRRDDLTEEQINACRLADNKTNESDWDMGKLEEELAALVIAGMDMEQFGFEMQGDEIENPYTQKTDIPQYDVSDDEVSFDDMYQDDKTRELLQEIEEADIDEATKRFLRVAAYRHIVFNYQKIADFYAKSGPETQRLMEKSALVIIDINDAIKNGYTLLRNEIADIVAGDMQYE